MTDKFDEVERPTKRPLRRDTMTAQIIATAETGKAIRVPVMRGMSFAGGLTRHLRGRGYRMHRHRDGDFFIVWAERIAENGAKP